MAPVSFELLISFFFFFKIIQIVKSVFVRIHRISAKNYKFRLFEKQKKKEINFYNFEVTKIFTILILFIMQKLFTRALKLLESGEIDVSIHEAKHRQARLESALEVFLHAQKNASRVRWRDGNVGHARSVVT